MSWENRDTVKKYAAELVKTVAEDWERVVASRRPA